MSSAPISKPDWKWLLLFLGVYLLFSLFLFDPKPDTGGDNVVYMLLGESLRTGQGYLNLHLPGAPAHVQYPFGLPVLLSFLFLVCGGMSVIAAKLMIVLSGLGAMVFVFLVMRRVLGDRAKWAMAAVVSMPMFAIAGHRVLTEMPFLCVSMAALYFLLRGEQDDSEAGWWVGTALAVGGVLLRTAGIALVLALAIHLVMKRRFWNFAGLLILFAAAFVPWQVRNLHAGGGPGYFEHLLARDPYVAELGRTGIIGFAARVGHNLVKYLFEVLPRGFLAALRAGPVAWVAGLVVFVLLKVGFWSRARRWTVLAPYAVLGFLVLLAWPAVWSGERFAVPLFPLFAVYVFFGLASIEQRLKWKRLVPVAAIAIVLLNLVAVGILAAKAIPDNLRYVQGDRYVGYSAGWRRYFQACEWLRDNTTDDAVVLARKPEFVYFVSGRRSQGYPFTNDRTRVQAAIDCGDYVLLEDFTWTETARFFLIPVLHEQPGRYRTVHTTGPPEVFVLEVGRPD